jgi:hypothetical protein
MIPPKGFQMETGFIGLSKGDDASILIFDNMFGNYYTNAADFNQEHFEELGSNVYEYKEYTIDGFPAKYIHIDNRQGQEAISLAFGDSTFGVMLMSVYPIYDNQTGDEIKKSFQTIQYDKTFVIDPLLSASFTLDTTHSDFKLALYTGGMFTYSTKKQTDASEMENPSFTVMTGAYSESMNIQEVLEMNFLSLKKYGMTQSEIIHTSPVIINGEEAYEMELYGYIKGEKKRIYLLVITGKSLLATIIGRLDADDEKNLEEIKRLAKTIQFK